MAGSATYPAATRFPRQDRDAVYDSVVSMVIALSALTMPVWLFFLFRWDAGVGGMVIVPIVAAVNLLLIMSVTRDDVFLRRCMISGLVFKIACAAAYWTASAYLWGSSTDAYGYMNMGAKWANQAQTLGYFPILQPWWGTNALLMATGILTYAIGSSFAAGGVIFACVGFWGQYFAYRAFELGVPAGNRKLAACFMFFLPSIAFWTAMVGKDPVLCLAVGLSAYGFVLVSTRINFVGLLIFGSGLAVGALIRPHVAALTAVAATLVMAFSGNRRGAVGTFTRMLVVPLALAVTVYVARNASEAWQISDTSDAMLRLSTSASDTAYGGSAFQQSSSWPVRLAMAPFLMFRPFPWEIRSAQMAVSALESLWMLVLFWNRRRQVMDAIRRARDIPILGFAILFTLEFAFTMAPGIGNFGLLVRQRVMVLPYTTLLLCMYAPVRHAIPYVIPGARRVGMVGADRTG